MLSGRYSSNCVDHHHRSIFSILLSLALLSPCAEQWRFFAYFWMIEVFYMSFGMQFIRISHMELWRNDSIWTFRRIAWRNARQLLLQYRSTNLRSIFYSQVKYLFVGRRYAIHTHVDFGNGTFLKLSFSLARFLSFSLHISYHCQRICDRV